MAYREVSARDKAKLFSEERFSLMGQNEIKKEGKKIFLRIRKAVRFLELKLYLTHDIRVTVCTLKYIY